MTIEHKLPSGTMLIVPVPSEAKQFKLVNYPRAGLYLKQTDSNELNGFDCKIPQGFKLLGLSTELTEQQLSGIMLTWNDNGLTKHFDYVKGYYSHSLFTDLESFASLKQYLKLDESKRWIILFKTS